jgi:hypothetical protein
MSCPVINTEDLEKSLKILSEKSGQDIESQLQELANERCETRGGKRRGRKMKGGDIITVRNIKIMIYGIIVILMSLASQSRTFDQVVEGMQMVLNGECSSMSNMLWSVVGLQNPVCRVYTRLMVCVLQALNGNNEARLMLIGLVVSVFAAPTTVGYSVDTLARQIEGAVRTSMQQIENGPPQAPQLKGGKTKRRHSRGKRTRRH